MALKYFFLILSVLGLACAALPETLEIMPLDTLEFDYLQEAPDIDGVYDATHETCDSRRFDDLSVRTCYYENHLYVYFLVNDTHSDKNDSFYMGFDVDKDNIIEKSEPKITVYRNGTATTTTYAFTYKTVNSSKGWNGEIAVFFEELNLPLTITPAKVTSGPNIRIKATGGSEGILGEFYNVGLGHMHSDAGWATPKDFECDIDPTTAQTWYHETNASLVMKMVRFSVLTNNEEPFLLNTITITGNGTGNELEQIAQVRLYKVKGYSTVWLANGTFGSDNGTIVFPINVQIKGDDVGANATDFAMFYKFNDNAGSVQSSNTSVPGTFMLKVASVSGTGYFSGATLHANNTPFYSSLLTTYDCVTDEGCASGQICSGNICITPGEEAPPSEPTEEETSELPSEEPSGPPAEEPSGPPTEEPSGPGEQPTENITPPAEPAPEGENVTLPNVTTTNMTTNESGIPGNATGTTSSGTTAPFEIDSSMMILAAAVLIFLAAVIIYLKKGKN